MQAFRWCGRSSLAVWCILMTSIVAASDSHCNWDAQLTTERSTHIGPRFIDISLPIRADTVSWESQDGLGADFPDHRTLALRIDEGAEAYLSHMHFPAHTGTHFDAPSHYLQQAFEGGKGIEAIPLDTFIGPALVIETPHEHNITAEVLESLNIPPGTDRVIFKTRNTARNLLFQTPFASDYTALTESGAAWVGDHNIRFVGIDYVSIATYEELGPGHRALMGRGAVPVEGLDLREVEPGLYTVYCMPIKLHGSDGAPGRCALSQL